MSKLAEQIEATSRNLESGNLVYGDVVLLNHILEEFALLVDVVNTPFSDDQGIEAINQLLAAIDSFVGSTAELVEDGLED